MYSDASCMNGDSDIMVEKEIHVVHGLMLVWSPDPKLRACGSRMRQRERRVGLVQTTGILISVGAPLPVANHINKMQCCSYFRLSFPS